METVRKLTIKSCGDYTVKRIKEEIETAKLKESETLSIIKLIGECSAAKTGQTDKGEYTRLAGNFIGTDLLTGELYQSGTCILPQFIGGQIASIIAQSGGLRFAFEIGVKRKDGALTGYEFVVKSLIDMAPTDAMKELLTIAGIDVNAAPKLKAPDPKAEPEPHPDVQDSAPAPAPAPAKRR